VLLQEESEEKQQQLTESRQKLSALESGAQKRISELENQLTEALSSAAAASGELTKYQLNVCCVC